MVVFCGFSDQPMSGIVCEVNEDVGVGRLLVPELKTGPLACRTYPSCFGLHREAGKAGSLLNGRWQRRLELHDALTCCPTL